MQTDKAGRLRDRRGPARRWLVTAGVVVAGLATGIVLATQLRPHSFTGTIVQSSTPAPPFTLESAAGPVSLDDLSGHVVVLFFGYTSCPDVCPTTLADLRATMGLLGKRADDIRVVFVSVDPERDTPEDLATFVSKFDPRFIGVTGDPGTIADLAAVYGIYYRVHDESDPEHYLIDHTATLTVIDKEGYLKLVFPYGTPPAAIAADLAELAG